MRRSDVFWAGPTVGLAVLALLAGLYAWLGRPHPRAPAAPTLLGTTLSQVTAVRMTTGGKTLTLFRNPKVPLGPTGPQWKVGSPAGPDADQTLAGDFITSLLALHPSRVVTRRPSAAELRAYGLKPPRTSVQVLRGSAPAVEMDVGEQSPIGDYYATVKGRPEVYLINTTVASQISANPNNWLPLPSTPSSGTTGSSG